MKRIITLIVLITGVSLLFVGHASAKWPPRCHDAFTMAGYSPNFAYIAVSVPQRRGLTCSQALHIGGKANALTGIIEIRGPEFGGGGWGGPFHVGKFNCFLMTRGSDFKNGVCWRGAQFVEFANHRQFWFEHDPNFHPPALKP